LRAGGSGSGARRGRLGPCEQGGEREGGRGEELAREGGANVAGGSGGTDRHVVKRGSAAEGTRAAERARVLDPCEQGGEREGGRGEELAREGGANVAGVSGGTDRHVVKRGSAALTGVAMRTLAERRVPAQVLAHLPSEVGTLTGVGSSSREARRG
jgi:hypothetical protein